MKIGDEIIIRGKIIDFDANPHGSAIKIEVKGFIDSSEILTLKPYGENIRFWIHRLDQPKVIFK